MTPAAYRAEIARDLARAHRYLGTPGTDRATLRWACRFILQHSRDASMRDAADTILTGAPA